MHIKGHRNCGDTCAVPVTRRVQCPVIRGAQVVRRSQEPLLPDVNMQARLSVSTRLRPAKVLAPGRPRARASVVVNAVQGSFDISVRPYTLRKGDSLASIAKKRGITVDQIVGINQDINPDEIAAGLTILLPAGKLSARDKEILDGIGTTYRLYPVRAGEALKDIINKRGITMEELEELNPGINLNKVKDNQLLKLPSTKFTVREREMLIGSGILPMDFFNEASKNPFALGLGGLLMVCGFVLAWQKFYKEDDEDLA